MCREYQKKKICILSWLKWKWKDVRTFLINYNNGLGKEAVDVMIGPCI